jgi:hypothetical protein
VPDRHRSDRLPGVEAATGPQSAVASAHADRRAPHPARRDSLAPDPVPARHEPPYRPASSHGAGRPLRPGRPRMRRRPSRSRRHDVRPQRALRSFSTFATSDFGSTFLRIAFDICSRSCCSACASASFAASTRSRATAIFARNASTCSRICSTGLGPTAGTSTLQFLIGLIASPFRATQRQAGRSCSSGAQARRALRAGSLRPHCLRAERAITSLGTRGATISRPCAPPMLPPQTRKPLG